MIARIWRGVTREKDVEAYLRYLRKTGLSEYASTPGNQGSLVLCRRGAGTAEFTLISFWDSLEVIEGFAGSDIARAVFYPEDDDFLVERELTVSHHEVLAREEPTPAGAGD